MKQIVRIESLDVTSLRKFERLVACGGSALIVLGDNFDGATFQHFATSSVPSFDPSSTTMTSISGHVCATAERTPANDHSAS